MQRPARRACLDSLPFACSSSGSLCLTCLVVLVVCLAFTAMVVYIKFTYLFGHRAPKVVHTAGAGAAAHAGAWGQAGGGAQGGGKFQDRGEL